MSQGFPTHAALGLHAELPALDLCSGKNRLGPPEAVLRAMSEAASTAHARGVVDAAARAVAARFQLDEAQVAFGPGANALLWTAAKLLIEPGGRWLSVEPAVTSFSAAARAAGARVTQWRAVERREHRVELDQVAELALLVEPKVVSSSAPADPSGTSLSFRSICALAEELPGTTFVVDQSWLSLSTDHADLELLPPKNVVCLRSLSVEVGLRVGYVLCDPELARRIAQALPPSAADAAAVAATLEQRTYLDACRSQRQAEAAQLRQLLTALQLTHSPSVTPFTLVRIARAQEVAEELLTQHHIAVYDATRVGLPDHLRIAAPAEAALPQLKTALEQVLERRKLVRGREV
ncbi:MAG TPA: aminotransferase class I/II-fold pyridoxal phosphate-dependent enzyme [Polyangiales bacterium]|nr:aminotransferase class I/II-fold pyridoxal phosphate-dependent enzyme [Polyangiales bacterium]